MDTNTQAKALADIVVRREAWKKNVRLGPNYWNSVVWKKKFAQQVMAAHSLLKVYSYEAIRKALDHQEIKWVYSLRRKDIIPYIKDEEAKLKQVREKVETAEEITGSTDSVGKSFSKKKNRLKDLD